MLPAGRWVVAAQAILASCTLASAGEGINWKRIAWKSPQESYSGRRITDAWEKVTDVLKEARNNATFPGCVAVVGNEHGFLYSHPLGSFTYGEPAPVTHTDPPMTTDTIFDLASLTKVLATTTASMILYQRGHLHLDMRVSDPSLLGPEFGRNGKEAITVRNLLLHNAGFPPDPNPNYWDTVFGCPQTANYHPAEDFSCQEKIYTALLNQGVQYSPGSKYVYSDLSMITMMHVVGTIARDKGYVHPSDLNMQCVHNKPNSSHSIPYLTQCYYEAFCRRYIVDYLDLKSMGFLPPPKTSSWADIAPTWNDTVYRHQVMQGYVSDGNSYALGGIAGHAGLFSDVGDIYALLHRLMFASFSDSWINSTTIVTFTTVYNTSQSSRALGWDTNNYNVKSTTGRLCGELSSSTFTHTGYTGTQVCCDPVRKVITILLTNRCYKDDSTRTKDLIALTRRMYNDAVVQVLH